MPSLQRRLTYFFEGGPKKDRVIFRLPFLLSKLFGNIWFKKH